MSRTVSLRDRLIRQGFTVYPPNALENAYDEMESPPPFEKYMKPARKNAKQFDTLWKMNLALVQLFRDFEFLYRNCFTDTTFYYMLEVYAEIELSIKDFNKELKKSDQFVKQYYQNSEFSDFYQLNVFDLIREDYAHYSDIGDELHERYLRNYPNAVPVKKGTMEEYIKEYKNALKNVKSKRDRSRKAAA